MSKLDLGDSLILDSDIVVNGGEVKTGATFNGKPVYAICRSLQFPSVTTDGTVATNDVDTGITDVLQVVNSEAFSNDTTYCFSLPRFWSTGSPINFLNACAWRKLPDRKLYVSTQTNRQGSEGVTAYVTAYYTKTTD